MAAAVRGSGPPGEGELALEVFREVVGHTLDALLISVPDGRILYANPAACEMFGASAGYLFRVGRRGIANEEDPKVQAALAERARTGQVRAVVPLTKMDGTPFLAEVSSTVFAVGNSGPMSCVILRDVTRRVHTERRVAAYNEVTGALLGRVDVPEVLAIVARHARTIFDADAVIITASQAGSGLVVAAADGPGTSELVGRSYPPSALAEKGMATREALLVEDFAWVAEQEDGRNLSLGPAIVAPIISDERVFGTLVVGFQTGRNPRTPDELAEVGQFAQRAGVALALGQARADAERDQKRRAEQLQHALDSRVVIEQAKGFIAAQRAIDAEEAFDRLRRYARSHNANIHDVAAAVLHHRVLI